MAREMVMTNLVRLSAPENMHRGKNCQGKIESASIPLLFRHFKEKKEEMGRGENGYLIHTRKARDILKSNRNAKVDLTRRV